jgi:hypothetical protein
MIRNVVSVPTSLLIKISSNSSKKLASIDALPASALPNFPKKDSLVLF